MFVAIDLVWFKRAKLQSRPEKKITPREEGWERIQKSESKRMEKRSSKSTDRGREKSLTSQKSQSREFLACCEKKTKGK